MTCCDTYPAYQLKRIHVHQHALDRWRERGAEYADAPKKDLKRALLDAKLVGEEDYLPPTIVRARGERYFHHERSSCYFITKPQGPDSCVIITVRCPGVENTNFINPKGRAVEPEPLAVPAFANPDDERDWLLARLRETQDALGEMGKAHPDRPEMLDRLHDLQERMAENKKKATDAQLRRRCEKLTVEVQGLKLYVKTLERRANDAPATPPRRIGLSWLMLAVLAALGWLL